jgi:acyl-CoA reductase-like NAD-dependent aldehyde dehydrogenase
MGNTIIIKPAEQTPLSALRLGALVVEAGASHRRCLPIQLTLSPRRQASPRAWSTS